MKEIDFSRAKEFELFKVVPVLSGFDVVGTKPDLTNEVVARLDTAKEATSVRTFFEAYRDA